MFKIAQSDRFNYPVSVEITGDGGRRQTNTFDATFKRLNREEFQAVVAQAQAGELDDAALARDTLLGWSGVQDADGNPLEFSDAHREALLNVWPVLPAVVSAFIEAHSPKGKAKN